MRQVLLGFWKLFILTSRLPDFDVTRPQNIISLYNLDLELLALPALQPSRHLNHGPWTLGFNYKSHFSGNIRWLVLSHPTAVPISRSGSPWLTSPLISYDLSSERCPYFPSRGSTGMLWKVHQNASCIHYWWSFTREGCKLSTNPPLTKIISVTNVVILLHDNHWFFASYK
jgi:hypothetical protein